MGVLYFNAFAGGDPLRMSNFRMIFLPDAEHRTIVSSFMWTKHRNVMDGRTDKQTDRQNALQLCR